MSVLTCPEPECADIAAGTAIRVSGLVRQSIVDGPGLRLALFTQGCRHHCPGCHNPGSHDSCGGYDLEPEDVIAEFDKNPLLAGITLSGGDPILQAARLLPVARAIRQRGKTIWCYTGYTFEQLQDKMTRDPNLAELCSLLHVLVDGRFEQAKRDLTLRFRGSTNQRLVDMPRSLATGTAVTLKM